MRPSRAHIYMFARPYSSSRFLSVQNTNGSTPVSRSEYESEIRDALKREARPNFYDELAMYTFEYGSGYTRATKSDATSTHSLVLLGIREKKKWINKFPREVERRTFISAGRYREKAFEFMPITSRIEWFELARRTSRQSSGWIYRTDLAV